MHEVDKVDSLYAQQKTSTFMHRIESEELFLTDTAKAAKAAYMKEWRQKNADAVREYGKRWREANKDHIKEYQERYWTQKAKVMTIE